MVKHKKSIAKVSSPSHCWGCGPVQARKLKVLFFNVGIDLN